MTDDPNNPPPRPSREVQSFIGLVRRALGRQYPALERELAKLPPDAQRDLVRFRQDLESHLHSLARKAREPWRR